MPFVPQGELETLGLGKESTFGTFVAPTIWHCFFTNQPKGTNDAVKRAPRASLASPYPGTGAQLWTSSVDVETDADTFPQWLAFSLGNQTTPSTSLVNTTLAGTYATGVSSFMLASTIGIYVGMTLTFDVSAQQETLIVAAITGVNTIQTTVNSTKSHSAGATVTLTATGAWVNKMTLGSPLPSFSMEVNRPSSVCTDYIGCKVDTLALAYAAKSGLTAKVGLAIQKAVTQGSPTSATLSALNPYIFEQQYTPAQMGGEVSTGGSSASLLSMNLSINNNLIKNWFTHGGGRLVRDFPEQIRSISGSATLGFESATQLNNFNANSTGGNLPSCSLLLPLVGTDLIGSSGIFYSIFLYLPKLFFSTHAIADDTTKAITQSITFECAESTPGANDQVQAYCYTGASAKY